MKRFSIAWLAVAIFLSFPLSANAAEKWEWKWNKWDRQAIVGKMARFSGQVLENGKPPAKPLEIVMTAFSKESGAPIFQAKTPANKGEFQFHFQFYDGSAHQVRFEAFRPGSETPLTVAQTEVEVTAISPPANVQVKTMVFLLFTVFAGMMAGVCWAKFRERKVTKRGSSDVLPSAT